MLVQRVGGGLHDGVGAFIVGHLADQPLQSEGGEGSHLGFINPLLFAGPDIDGGGHTDSITVGL